MGKKAHSGQKEITEREDKHRPKSKAEKKSEQQQHKLKVKPTYLTSLIDIFNIDFVHK